MDDEPFKEAADVFADTLLGIIHDIIEDKEFSDIPETTEWLQNVLSFNLHCGKYIRGGTVVLAYHHFDSNGSFSSPTIHKMKLACILGWCVEILHAGFLIMDDIINKCDTRRGQPCWYKVDNVGRTAVNDAFMLENLVYHLLRKYFRKMDYYLKLVELFRETSLKAALGQGLDVLTSVQCSTDLPEYRMAKDRYKTIVKNKISYYSFYLPVYLGFTLCGLDDKELLGPSKNIVLLLGKLYQVQDDFLDFFGDPDETGRKGNDISNGKCTWLLLQALRKSNQSQRQLLINCYGKADKVAQVEKLYEELCLLTEYQNYEQFWYYEIRMLVDDLPERHYPLFFRPIMYEIYHRKK